MDMYSEKGIARTDMHCHDCSKNFIAALNFDLDGNHIIICPRCGHQHCRVIVKGVVTGDRFDSKHDTIKVSANNVWRGTDMITTTASHFLRDRWLNTGG